MTREEVINHLEDLIEFERGEPDGQDELIALKISVSYIQSGHWQGEDGDGE